MFIIKSQFYKFAQKTIEFKKNPLNLLLIAVLVLGLTLRFLGVYPGYSPYHPDEGKDGYSSAWFMFVNRTLDLPHYHYPALIPIIELVFLALVLVPALWLKLMLFQPDLFFSNLDKLPQLFDSHIAGRSDIEIMYMSRYLSALAGTLTLLLTYLVGKKLFKSRLAALLSVTVLSVNMRHIMSSHFDLPDGFNSFFLLLAFYVLIRLKDNPTARLYALSGFATGLVISVKLQLFSLLPFVITHFYLAFLARGWKKKVADLFSPKIFYWALVLVLTIVFINIGPLTHLQEFINGLTNISHLYGFNVNRFGLTGLSFFYNVVLTPKVAFVFLLGVAVGIFRYRLSMVLILSLIIAYMYYFLYFTKGWYYPRNFVGVIPFFALVSGAGLAVIWDALKFFLKRQEAALSVFIVVILMVLFEPAKNSIIHTWSYMQPWNITSMRECIRQNIINGKTVAAHPTDKYMLFSLPSFDVTKQLDFIPHDRESSYSLAELQEEKADYALINLDFVGDATSVWWMTRFDVWQKPVEISSNVFVGLAARELFTSAVCSKVKPWQAVENNYIFVRVPSPVKSEWSMIDSFEFNSKDAFHGWHKVDGSSGGGDNLIWDGVEGKSKEGSLKIKTVSPVFPVVRWISPLFEIKPGSFYKAVASIKSSTNVDLKQRDGFLRLDFYKDEPTVWNEETLGLSHNLSSRYFGEKEWKNKEVVGLAPKDARFATIGFQASAPSVADFWFDDVIVYEGQYQNALPKVGQSDFWFMPDEDVFIPNLGSGY